MIDRVGSDRSISLYTDWFRQPFFGVWKANPDVLAHRTEEGGQQVQDDAAPKG